MLAAAASATYPDQAQDTDLQGCRTGPASLEAEIKLEKDTIELLRADEALLAQPSRLERLVTTYAAELQLVPTEPTQLARPMELPMLKDQLPIPEGEEGTESVSAPSDPIKDLITTGSVDR
ncbi:MAG: hypothetical protein KL839_19970 [Rhizobium sp.]|nr:hypothetical protein [Rhizobium sp.]